MQKHLDLNTAIQPYQIKSYHLDTRDNNCSIGAQLFVSLNNSTKEESCLSRVVKYKHR